MTPAVAHPRRENTASVYLLRGDDSPAAEICLVWHRRLQKWAIPGGHQEEGESIVDTARREVLEETGCEFDFVVPEPPLDVEEERFLPMPWWIAEQELSPTDPDHHIHVDHLFVGLLSREDAPLEDSQVCWFSLDGLPSDKMFRATYLLASRLLRNAPELRNRRALLSLA